MSASPYADSWNGTMLTGLPSPDPAVDLSAISCATSTWCVAVGLESINNSVVTVAEQWDGTSWRLLPTPNPTAATDSRFTAVSCVSATDCTAVGTGNASGIQTLAESWNGTSWMIESTPNVSGGASSYLNAVSCPATTTCIAVGDSVAGAVMKTLVEKWTG
jgi:hypothetical protein